MRRHDESFQFYESLQKLCGKCVLSGFNPYMVKRILRTAHFRKKRFGPQKSKTEQELDKVI